MTNDMITIKSDIEIEIINAKTGEIEDIKHFHNILTNLGIKWIRNQLANISSLVDPNFNVDTRLTHVAVGDGNSTPMVTQLVLDNELLRKELHPTPDVNCEIVLEDDDKVIYIIFINETELTGDTIREIGLFSESYTPFMISRALTGNLYKGTGKNFKIKYKYIIQNGS